MGRTLSLETKFIDIRDDVPSLKQRSKLVMMFKVSKLKMDNLILHPLPLGYETQE